MPDQILESIKKTDNFLNSTIDRDQKRLAKSIAGLEKKIIHDLDTTLSTDRGRLVSPRVNLNQAQQIHKDLTKIFDETYGKTARTVVQGYDDAADFIKQNYASLGESMKFTGVDRKMIDILKNAAYDEYTQFGKNAQDRIANAMYSHIGARSSMEELTNNISGILSGSLSRNGRPMEQYASLWANDGVMNFHNQVNIKKGKDLGMKYFLYYGNIMLTSRSFCKLRAGKVYSEDEINSWTFPWSGKSGPAMTHRGGWNCRHHWQPIRKKWVPEGEISVESVFPYEEDPDRQVLGKVKRESGPAHVVRPKNPSLPSTELSKMHTEVQTMGNSFDEKEIRSAVNDGSDTRLVAYRDETGKLTGASSYRIDKQNSSIWINHLGALDDVSRDSLLLKVKDAATVDGMGSVRVQAPQFKRSKKWWRARGFGLKRGELFMHAPTGRIKIPTTKLQKTAEAAVQSQTELAAIQKTDFRLEEEKLFKIQEDGASALESFKQSKVAQHVSWESSSFAGKQFWQYTIKDFSRIYANYYKRVNGITLTQEGALSFVEKMPEWKKINKLQEAYLKQAEKVVKSKVWTTVSMNPVKSSSEAKILQKQIKDDYGVFRQYATKISRLASFDNQTLDFYGNPRNIVAQDTQFSLKKIFAEQAIKMKKIVRYQRYNWYNTLTDAEFLDERWNVTKKFFDQYTLNAHTKEQIIDLQRLSFLGTQHVPIDLLEDMIDHGYKIRFSKRTGRAFFRGAENTCFLYKGDSYDVIAHEYGHAIDHFFSGKTSTGGLWTDQVLGERYVTSKTGERYRREYAALHGPDKGMFANGDGEYWKGRFLDEYEGRIYSSIGGETGSEWFSMNMQRYATQRTTDEFFNNNFLSMKYLGDDYFTKINKLIRRIHDSSENWYKVKEAYPWMHDFITENFSKKFWNYSF